MKADAEANADADKKAKETAEKINGADAMIFQTESQLKNLEINFLLIRKRLLNLHWKN